MTPHDWSAACDLVVAELLDAGGISAPPVDALGIAARLNWPVVYDASQTGRARLQRLEGRPTLFVRPEERPERLQWAVAHEIGEVTVWRVCQRLDLAPEELSPRRREESANQIAQRLLLPTRWFDSLSRASGHDLFVLKKHFVTASHELIAWRWLDGDAPTIITVFDNGEQSRRRCNFAPRAPALTSEEAECVTAARANGGCERRGWPGGEATSWAIHEPHWQREILRTIIEWE